jgi:NitT/TauT family transport system permease protein
MARRAGHPGRRVARALEPALVTLGVLAVWELVVRVGLVSDGVLSAPTAIVGKLADDLQGAELWDGVWETVRSWAIGMGLVIATAVPLGLLLGGSRIAYRGSRLTVEFLRTIPSIAALPFLILLLGAGSKLTVVLVVLSAFWPLLVQTMYGVHDVDPVTRQTGRVYGLGRLAQFRRIVLPSALPYVATGVRLAAVLGMIIAIGASLVAGGSGLGYEIGQAQNNGQIALMYARIVVAGLLGVAVTAGLLAGERRLLHWHPSQRRGR